MARRRGQPGSHGPKARIDIGTRVDGYRVERIVSTRPGLNTLAEAATLRGERVTLDVVAVPLKEDRELRRRMTRLVPLRATIDHPNVLRLLRSVDGGQRLHMESIPKGAVTLADLLRDGPLERTQALRILGQIAGALETARARGLVHRALSPRAIIVQPGDEPAVFLTDFGMGAPRGRACELPSAIEDAHYRAPEEIRGDSPEPASNVYSLTCMLVECLTGAPPYERSRPLLALHAQLTEPPPRLSERDEALPAELDAVVARGMAKNPREREGSPGALVNAAAHSLGLHVPIPVARPARKQPAAKSAPRPDARLKPALDRPKDPKTGPEPTKAPKPARRLRLRRPALRRPASAHPATKDRHKPPPPPPRKRRAAAPPTPKKGLAPPAPPGAKKGQAPAPPAAKKGQAPAPPAAKKRQAPVPPAAKKRQAPAPPAAKKRQAPAPPAKERHAPTPAPKPPRRGDHAARPAGRARKARRRAPALAALALMASAVAGFATGNAAWSDDRPAPAATTEPVRQAPAEPSDTRPVVTQAIDRLDARRTAIRRKLTRARRAHGQASAARSLAAAYGAAEEKIARAASTDAEERLAGHLAMTEDAYEKLAAAGKKADAQRWRAARQGALESERELELLLRTRTWT